MSAGKTDIILGENLSFPGYGEKSLTSQVIFVTGKRGSGKSWTTGVMMEEMERLNLLLKININSMLCLILYLFYRIKVINI